MMKVFLGVMLGLALAVGGMFAYDRLVRRSQESTEHAAECAEVQAHVRQLDAELATPIPKVDVPQANGGDDGPAADLQDLANRMDRQMAEDRQARKQQERERRVGTNFALLVRGNPQCFSVEERTDAEAWLLEVD